MGLLSFLSPISNLFKSHGPKKDPYAALVASLQPYLDQQKKISQNAFESGTGDINSGRSGVDNLINYYSKYLSGNRDFITKDIDLSGVTKSYDQAEQQTADFGVRGGRSASMLAGLPFEKLSAINKIVQQVRSEAPHELGNLYGMLLNLGSSELSTSLGASGANISSLFNVQELKDAKDKAEADRRAAIISSIFSAGGAALGGYLGGR
jgi:hypothetical protein